MIVWCPKCETEPIDVDDGQCQPCLYEWLVTKPSKPWVVYREGPYISADTLVSVEIDGKLYTDTYKNLTAPLYDDTVLSMIKFCRDLDRQFNEDHIIRSEN